MGGELLNMSRSFLGMERNMERVAVPIWVAFLVGLPREAKRTATFFVGSSTQSDQVVVGGAHGLTARV